MQTRASKKAKGTSPEDAGIESALGAIERLTGAPLVEARPHISWAAIKKAKFTPEQVERIEYAVNRELRALDEPGKNFNAQALSALGASKGGQARAASLSKAKRAAIAKKAAAARWGKKA